MRKINSRFLPVAVLTIILLFSATSYAQIENLQGLRLNDGSVIYGKVLQINIEKVTIEGKDGKISTYKFNDVQTFIKEGQEESAAETLKGTAEIQPDAKAISTTLLARHRFEIGPEWSYIKYEEPGVMEQKGLMYGISGAYSYHNNIMLGVDAKLSYGQVDYKNSGTINNIDDLMFEIRAVGGYDFKLTDSLILTPYIGIAYRYLRDDSGGRISSTGAAGYLRESNYYYSPIGITLTNDLRNSWAIGFAVEYDLFWKGIQKSYLSDVDPRANNPENNQNSGYGVKGSIIVKKSTGRVTLLFEPFIRYWNIAESDKQKITLSGVDTGWVLYEPKNNSTEIGLKFSVGF
jgi:hypothetical protein